MRDPRPFGPHAAHFYGYLPERETESHTPNFCGAFALFRNLRLLKHSASRAARHRDAGCFLKSILIGGGRICICKSVCIRRRLLRVCSGNAVCSGCRGNVAFQGRMPPRGYREGRFCRFPFRKRRFLHKIGFRAGWCLPLILAPSQVRKLRPPVRECFFRFC